MNNLIEWNEFVNDMELKKKYNEEPFPSGLKLDEACIKSFDLDDRCVGFYEFLEIRKEK